jgi:protein phosphatase
MPVKNADVIDGHVVLATELSYRTLDDCSRPMSVRRIVSTIAQVLDGLTYAHRNRLVHCDVTPGNIFLFPNGRAALGDFGISLQFKGRMKTIDEYGTPGYVSPEQAYGRPTYRSDCFAVGLILYEFITGVLPRWPFRWPMRGHKRLRERTNTAMINFLRKSLTVDPDKLAALLQAAPKDFKKRLLLPADNGSKLDWRKVRRETFVKRYSKVLPRLVKCIKCHEPVAESMMLCPWCGSERNRFDSSTRFSRICPDCHKGVLPEWRFCPWCYGPGFRSPSSARSVGVRYHTKCRYCGERLMRFMCYVPGANRAWFSPGARSAKMTVESTTGAIVPCPFRWSAASDKGKVRPENEDSFIVEPEAGLLLVADGIGGHRGGRLAADIVAEDLPVMIENKLGELTSSSPATVMTLLKQTISEQNRQLVMEGTSETGYKGMGATLVVTLLKDGRAYIANLGDSRMYRSRKGRLRQFSKDHSVVSELVSEGKITPEEAENHAAANQITHYVGMEEEEVAPHVRSFALIKGDRLLLCTDGLTGEIDDGRITAILEGRADCQAACEALVSAANAAGGHDNITVIVIDWLGCS